jgi:SHS2 domain-containing protein
LIVNLRKEELNKFLSGEFRYIDHTADIAVQIAADSVEDLFIISANALVDSTADNIVFGNTDVKKIHLNEYSLEELLVGFLNELNFFFSARKWLLKSIVRLKIEEYENIFQLKSECEGSSEVEYSPKDEIKAITFHQMEIVFKQGRYQTTIVFDI